MMATASARRDGGQKTGFFARIFGRRDDPMGPLYASVIRIARQRQWYADYAVPDTVDGRFDMMTLALSLVLLRMERETLEVEPVRLTEAFIADMDGQIRESGFGDLVVGKKVGGIMALLGGRLGAYRSGIDGPVLVRTLWRNDPPLPETVEATVAAVAQLRQRIDATPMVDLMAGRAG